MKTSGLAVAVIVVSACAVAVADQITLKTGDVLIGEVTERSDDHVRLEHPVLGSLAIPAEQVASVAVDATGQAPVVESPAGQVEAAQVGDKAESSAKPQAARTPKRRLLFAGWDASLEIGINGSQGNSETLNARVAFNAAKEDDLHRWKIAASHHTATSGGDTTRNESMAGLTKDWLLPGSLWFYFAAGRIDIDEFESWDFRLSGTGGIGLELVNRGDLEARVRAGLGGRAEFGGNADDKIKPEASLGGELVWQINDRQQLSISSTVYPELAEFGELRITLAVDWQLKIDQADDISLKVGLKNEYESGTEGDAEHNDLKYYLMLLHGF